MNNPLRHAYDQSYFIGKTKSNYDDYSNCDGCVSDMAKMIDLIVRPSSVFDAGAAYGFAVRWWKSRRTKASGCDISDFAVAKSNGIIYQHDITTPLPEADRSYDIVICTECLEHIQEEHIQNVLLEFMRIARRAVVVCIAFSDDPSQDGDATHVNLKLRGWWQGLFSRMGIFLNLSLQDQLNKHPLSKKMKWAGRWFVLDSSMHMHELELEKQ